MRHRRDPDSRPGRASSRGRVFLAAGWLAATPAIAAAQGVTGEFLRVTADALHLRDGASLAAVVLGSLPEGTRLLVVARDGVWVEVDVRESDGALRRGWVHGRHVEPEGQWRERAGQPRVVATAEDVAANAAGPMQEFRREYAKLDAAFRQATGKRLFSAIEEQPGRVLVVTATPLWLEGTAGDREDDAVTLLSLWKTANSDYPSMVRIVNEAGKVLFVAY